MPRAAAKSSPRKQNDKAAASAEAPTEFVIKNAREFRAAYQPSGGYGGVFCPTRSKLRAGDPVAVRVRLGAGPAATCSRSAPASASSSCPART
jgi:hypothetical protein